MKERRRSEAHIPRRSSPHEYLTRIIGLVKFCVGYLDECYFKNFFKKQKKVTTYPELIAMHEEPLNFEEGSWEVEI